MARSAKKRAAAFGDILSGAGEAPLCCCLLQDLPSRAVPAAIYAPRAASPLPRRPAPRALGLDFSKVATWKGLTCADSTRGSASPLVGCQRPALPGCAGKPSEGLGAARGPGAEDGEAGGEGTARRSGGRRGRAVLGRSTGVAGAGSSRAAAMLGSREPRPRPCAAPSLSTSGCPGLGTQPGRCQQPPGVRAP